MPDPWLPEDPRLTQVWLRRDLLDGGMHDRAIATAVSSGQLHRVRHGSYVDGQVWRGLDAVGQHVVTSRAVLRRAGTEVRLSHRSSLAVWEVPLWDQPLDAVDITRVDGRAGRREVGVIQHLGVLEEGDTVELHGIPVTSPARAVMETLCLTDVEHGLVLVNDLLFRRLVSSAQLYAMAARMERWPGSLTHQLVLRLADGRSGQSVGEGRTRWLLHAHRLPAPSVQHPVRGASGREYFLDFAWPERKVWLEFDGLVKYQGSLRPGQSPSEAVVAEKKREDDIRAATGWRCIRITWADLARPERLARLIREALNGSLAA